VLRLGTGQVIVRLVVFVGAGSNDGELSFIISSIRLWWLRSKKT
jgi:hypothetical protein